MTRVSRYLAVALVVSGAIVGPAMAWAKKPDHAGGGAGDGDSAGPIVSFHGDVSSVSYGGSVHLSWAADARSCEASGDWSGKKAVSGAERVEGLRSDARFVLTCKQKKASTSEVVSVTVEGAPKPSPNIALSVNPTVVEYDGTVSAIWDVTNADSCEAFDGWSGLVGVQGSREVGPLQDATRLTLRCQGEGGTAETAVTVEVEGAAPAPAPVVEFTADATNIGYEGFVTLDWAAFNADDCTAGGGWLGDVGTSGSQVQGPLFADTSFSLSCSGPGGTAIQSLSVAVSNQGGDTGSVPPVPSDVPIGTVGDGSLETMVASYQYHYDLPAMAVVVTRGDQIAEWTAVGRRRVDQNDQVTLQDRWHLGSLTKALTGTLAGVLVDQGKISWDTRVIDVWPEWKGDIRSTYESATLRQLTSHTAGLPNDVFAVPSVNQLMDGAPGTVMDKRRLWARELLNQAPAASSGSYYYTNAGFIVAGAMLEAVSGIPWEQMMTTHVFDPLGMTTAGFGAPDGENALGHESSGSGLEPVTPGAGADNPVVMGPAGTAHASLSDYAAFMVEHLRGSRGIDGVVSAETFSVLQAPVSSRAAIGWGIGYLNSSKLLGHSGSNGKWWTRVWLAPDYDAGIFIATNAANQDAQNAVDALQHKLLQRATELRW